MSVERALRGTPTRLAFRALCAAVARTGADLAAVERRLAGWPDDVREAPYSWVAGLESGFTKTVWPLVRSVDLHTGQHGMRRLAVPDPRVRAEVRGVTRVKLSWYAMEQVAALPEIAEHWEALRAVEFRGLMKFDGRALTRFVAGEAFQWLESLVADASLPIDRPTALRHIGMRAPGVVRLLRNGFVPELRSAEVHVATVEEARELADCPLAELDLALRFDCDATEFFSRADLGNLTSLKVRGGVPDVDLPALEHLDLSGEISGSPHYYSPVAHPIGDVRALARLPRLKSLNLAATGLADLDEVMALPLESLDVSGNPLGGLPDGPAWQTLRGVRADDCAIGELDWLPDAPELDGISLAHNDIDSDGVRKLARWSVTPQLWELNLHDNVIGDDGLVEFARSGAAENLLELDLAQDAWTAGRRRYRTPLPAEVLEAFPNLDAVFTGVVDGYHGTRPATGLLASERPAVVAFLKHVKPYEFDEAEERDPDPPAEDFRDRRRGRP
ncbi:leucine-rich repeat domain-containing protein [Lentzea sp. NPDC058450]|uniref:leucine-rich repeat domain-containing protein n=1 Tax=Lentzea sp. NPDC058450 TaxID=3346505 RepID=UPI00366995BD